MKLLLIRSGLGNVSIKTGSETVFLAQNLDRFSEKDVQGRISDRKAEQVFKTVTRLLTGYKTGSQVGKGTLFYFKKLS